MTDAEKPDSAQFVESRNSAIAWIALGVLMPAAYFGWVTYGAMGGKPIDLTEIAIVGGVIAVLGLSLAASSIGTLLDRTPSLIIDRNHLQIPRIVAQPIPWDHISALKFRADHFGSDGSSRRNIYLIIDIEHPALYPAKRKGILGRWLSWYYRTPYILGLESLGGTPEEVVEDLRRLAPREVKFIGDIEPDSTS